MRPKLLIGLAAALITSALARAQGLPPPPPPPAGNPITQAKINLGKTLFWDEQLSSTNTMACGTCHITGFGGSDPRTALRPSDSLHPGFDGLFQTADDVLGSPGVAHASSTDTLTRDSIFGLRPQVTPRRTMTMINSAYTPSLFWDGRADGVFEDPITGAVVLNGGAGLESQAAGPVVSGVEMGHDGVDWASVANRIAPLKPLRLSPGVPAPLTTYINGRTYDQLFTEAFGSAGVTPTRIAMAIATYERILVANQAPMALPPGAPGSQLTQLENQGRQIFGGPGRCVACHGGPVTTDSAFHYTGVRPPFEDLGRFNVTGQPGDRGAMKTPSLYNVELRAPYFHDGSAATLEEVVDFYDRGGDFNAPNKPPSIAPIGLTQQQKNALVAFLKRPMTDPRVAAQTAPFDRPLLYSESSMAPTSFGVGTAGAGGFTPEIYAYEPPSVGNTSWTVGIDRGNAGRTAILIVGLAGGPTPIPFQGAQLYVALNDPLTQRIRYGALEGSGAGDGWGSISVDLPTSPLLAGIPMYAQWAVVDPDGMGRRLATSVAVEMLLY